MKLMQFGTLPIKVSEIGFGTSQLANTDNQYFGVKYLSTIEAKNIRESTIVSIVDIRICLQLLKYVFQQIRVVEI